ncbi:MAG TPA: exosortase/archaeosortase family protein [Novosphingobium sp.]|nr:exosortase/archaeosortase family protein [Novosphingobium sp.]
MSVPRERLFAFAYLLLTLNALTTFVGVAMLSHGWLGATLNLFDVSAIVWLAIAAGLALLWEAKPGAGPRQGDALMLGAAVLAALIPMPVASSAMLTALALWGWLTAERDAALRRASAIFLSVTAFLLWGRIGLAWGAGPLLESDARFVALISGMRSSGNAVDFADGTHFLIAPGCSSLHGISLALILWTTVVQYFAIRPDVRVWLTLALAIVASILVNGVRLSIIAWNPHDFTYWHTGTGGALFGWIALAVVVAVVYRGLARARRLV